MVFVERWEPVLQNEYIKVHRNVTSVEILELEDSVGVVLCHHEIYISDPVIPNVSTFWLSNATLFEDSTATTDGWILRFLKCS